VRRTFNTWFHLSWTCLRQCPCLRHLCAVLSGHPAMFRKVEKVSRKCPKMSRNIHKYTKRPQNVRLKDTICQHFFLSCPPNMSRHLQSRQHCIPSEEHRYHVTMPTNDTVTSPWHSPGGPGDCADSWDPSLIFDPKFCQKPTPHNLTRPMKLFLVHTMLFVGSIWKNKSG
jgi:hypothetical protein